MPLAAKGVMKYEFVVSWREAVPVLWYEVVLKAA